ncbi:MAG: GAF domain-containing sensor histidine kinase [Anaerolineales bacterium]
MVDMGDRTVSGEELIIQILEISRLVAKAEKAEAVLPELVNRARKLIIFDNFVIYLKDGEDVQPFFARAVGRGRSKEADVAWGEKVVGRIIQADRSISQKDKIGDPEEDRLNLRFYMGTPLKRGKKTIGALILIRFGGPPFTGKEVQTAEFIAGHVAHLLERENLINTLQNIEDSQRMWKMQEDFVATVSHDLRTPLGFIKGYTTTLLREDTNWDVDTYREFLGIIDDEADRLQALIDNLLDSSRLQSGTLQMQFQKVNMDVILRDLIQRTQLSDLNIQILMDIQGSGLKVKADPMRLGQVFDNLLNNAAKYATGSKVQVKLREEDHQVHITVQDQGPGIAEEHLEKIFQRFYRVPETKLKERGSGLGLYICREIVQAHGGEIYAESEVGEGTTFHIFLPLDEE